MTDQPRARYKVGDKVQMQSGAREVGRVVEVNEADSSRGQTIYKIGFPLSADTRVLEVTEADLKKTCLPETGMPPDSTDPIYAEPTRKSGFCYTFTGKHHGGGKSDDARWLPSLSRADEFSVFDGADYHDFSDDRQWLYGVLRSHDGTLGELGTWQQQVAEFPFVATGGLWHGYPIWSVSDLAPPNRRGEKMRPSKEVFEKMEHARVITKRERKRLYKGDHV
ncbi:MAG: hypothetical protein ACLQNE_09105 [Thermoguttaceae bacterium]